MTDPTELKLISSNKCFNGLQNVYEHFRYNLNRNYEMVAKNLYFLK